MVASPTRFWFLIQPNSAGECLHRREAHEDRVHVADQVLLVVLEHALVVRGGLADHLEVLDVHLGRLNLKRRLLPTSEAALPSPCPSGKPPPPPPWRRPPPLQPRRASASAAPMAPGSPPPAPAAAPGAGAAAAVVVAASVAVKGAEPPAAAAAAARSTIATLVGGWHFFRSPHGSRHRWWGL